MSGISFAFTEDTSDILLKNISKEYFIRIKGSDAELFLQGCDHLLILLILQENRIGICDLKTAAKFKTSLVLGNNVEMKVRIRVAEGPEIDLGASPELLTAPEAAARSAQKSFLSCSSHSQSSFL